MRLFWQDFLYAFRVLFKRPGPTFLAVLALSLSIGLTTTTFSVLNGIFFKGFPHPDGPQLHLIGLTKPEHRGPMLGLPQASLAELNEALTTADGACGFFSGTINYSGDERAPQRVEGTYITANFLEVVREPVVLGRAFHQLEPAELPHAILLSHHLWKQRYQENPDIVGREVRINGILKTIVGVMPEDFVFPLYTEVWTVLDPSQRKGNFGEMSVTVLSRLHDDCTLAQLNHELTKRSERLLPEAKKEGYALQAEPFGMASLIQGGNNTWMGIQMAVIIGLLLIACANVANLLLGRAAARGRELAIRAALGANRRRLILQLLSESLVLALLGAVGGLLIAFWQVDFDMRTVNKNMPAWLSFDLDARVYLFVVILILAVSLLAGILPAFQASRVELNEMLKDGARTANSFRISTFTKVLTVGQIAFSCALLFGAGLAARHFQHISTIDCPFEPDEILTMRMGLFEQDYPTEESREAFVAKLLARVNAIPDVAQAAATTWISEWHMPSSMYSFQLYGDDPAQAAPAEVQYSAVEYVTPGYFETFQAGFPGGHGLAETDNATSSAPAIVVNQSFADKFLPTGSSALGRRMDLYMAFEGGAPTPVPVTIVGIVENLFFSPLLTENSEAPPLIYVPFAEKTPTFLTLVVRTKAGDAHSLNEPVHAAIQEIDPHLPPYFVRSMEEYYSSMYHPIRMFVSLLLLISIVALFLAAVGVYSLMAFSVSLRRQEFGVRMAVGARRRNLVRMVLHEGLTQLVVGIMLGLGLSILLGFALSEALSAVLRPDPFLLSIILGVLTLATLLALLVPLRRTARLSPMEALRYE